MPSALGTQELQPVQGHPWEAALHGLRADALDCLQTTPALIADHTHGSGAHLALGCRWLFPARGHDGAIGVPASLEDRLGQARDLLGLRCAPPQGPVDATGLRRRLERDATLHVVADAYDLPWVPYAGHRHMRHGFLLAQGGRGYTVVDAYHNDTEWGPARPGAWRLPADRLEQVARGGAQVVDLEPPAALPAVDPAAVQAANATRARAAAADIEAYADAVGAGLDRPGAVERLVLDVWLLGRQRLLHGAWLADRPGAGEVAARAEAWQRLAAQSYLALRRAQRGGAFNRAVLDDLVRLLHADVELVVRLATPAPRGDGADRVAAAVLGALGLVLELDDRTVRTAETLRDLPRFDSFRLVEVVERVERELGVQVPAEVAADDLHDVAGLCRLFARAADAAAGPGR